MNSVLPGAEGLGLLKDLLELQPEMEIICLTGEGNIRDAVEAMRMGANDYVTTPVEPGRLIQVVERATQKAALRREARRQEDSRDVEDMVIGDSPRMKQVKYLLEKVAPTDVPVLLHGPSGAGKEVLAHAIQRRSLRRSAPFIIKNCASLSKELARSELFGHMRGSFTGATADSAGLFAEADKGTLFLDEIGDLPLDVQPSLLRALENGTYRPVGGREIRTCDVRLIFATNRNLAAAVEAGTFNEALYHRIHVFTLELPSLSEHAEDIPRLVEHFLRVLPLATGRDLRVDPAIYGCLKSYSWPGNVRELRNVIERAIILADNGLISGKGLPPEIACSSEACGPSSAHPPRTTNWQDRHAPARSLPVRNPLRFRPRRKRRHARRPPRRTRSMCLRNCSGMTAATASIWRKNGISSMYSKSAEETAALQPDDSASAAAPCIAGLRNGAWPEARFSFRPPPFSGAPFMCHFGSK